MLFGFLLWFRVPPVSPVGVGAVRFRCAGVLRCLPAWVVCVGVFFSCLWGVLMASLPSLSSLSPLASVSWGSAAVVDRLGWCAASRSVLVWVLGPGFSSSEPLRCRVGRSSPAAVSALVASLRAARDSRLPVCLGVRSGWAGSRWFCAVAPASERACAASDAALSAELGRPLSGSLAKLRVLCRERADLASSAA